MNTDFFGKPAGTERIDFSSIHKITVKHGLLQDSLIIFINPKKPVMLRVTRWLRVHTDNFASAFAKQNGLQL